MIYYKLINGNEMNEIVTSVTITVGVTSAPDPNNEKLKTVTKNDQK